MQILHPSQFLKHRILIQFPIRLLVWRQSTSASHKMSFGRGSNQVCDAITATKRHIEQTHYLERRWFL